MIGIYKITSPTKKIYIGQSVNINARFSRYKKLHCKEQSRIYRSLLKYGVDKHKFEIICQCKPEELNDLEIYYIDLYQTFNNDFGLNLQSGGGDYKMSDETKLKKSKSATGRVFSQETKDKISKANTGKIRTKEVKLKLSIAAKKKFESPEAREVVGRASRGRPVSLETRKKLSLLKTGKTMSVESRLKSSLTQKGRKFTEEHKLKLSLSHKGKKFTDLQRKNHGEAIKTYWNNKKNK